MSLAGVIDIIGVKILTYGNTQTQKFRPKDVEMLTFRDILQLLERVILIGPIYNS